MNSSHDPFSLKELQNILALMKQPDTEQDARFERMKIKAEKAGIEALKEAKAKALDQSMVPSAIKKNPDHSMGPPPSKEPKRKRPKKMDDNKTTPLAQPQAAIAINKAPVPVPVPVPVGAQPEIVKRKRYHRGKQRIKLFGDPLPLMLPVTPLPQSPVISLSPEKVLDEGVLFNPFSQSISHK